MFFFRRFSIFCNFSIFVHFDFELLNACFSKHFSHTKNSIMYQITGAFSEMAIKNSTNSLIRLAILFINWFFVILCCSRLLFFLSKKFIISSTVGNVSHYFCCCCHRLRTINIDSDPAIDDFHNNSLNHQRFSSHFKESLFFI